MTGTERTEAGRTQAERDDGAVRSVTVEEIPGFERLGMADQERLREMAASLEARGMPPEFVESSLRSTAEVMQEIREDYDRADNVMRREHVRRFIEENAVPETGRPEHAGFQKERKRYERERLLAMATRLLREARLARGRHEIKKTRNMLLKLDQRELRRVLGREGEDLCRQINTWLRSTAAMF